MKRLVLAVCVLAATAGCLGAVSDPTQDGPERPGDAGFAPGNGTLAIHYLDVGQADATFVRGPAGDTMLIDTGDWPQEGETVIAYLEERGVERIDHLVSTHGHADHIGGSAEVIDHYETEHDGVGTVWDSGVAHTSQTYADYLDAIDRYNVTLYRTYAGDEIPLNGTQTTVANPPAERETDDLHPNSVVVRIRHGRAGFLFTGDAERETETHLRERWDGGLRSTVFQAGHHGSRTSNSGEFLAAVDPRVGIVSAANDSQYGHPHEEPLARFAERGVDVYWTATHGTVVAQSDGTTVTISTAVAATTDPSSIRDAPAADVAATASVERRETYDATVGNASAGEARDGRVPDDAGAPVATDGSTGGVTG